jgi:hypothetical protein
MNPRPSGPSRPLRALAIVTAGAVLLIAAASIAVAVLLPHDRVLALVRAQLARSLRREARIADVSVRLWPPVRLAARGFELAEPGGFAQKPAVSVRTVALDLDLLALLGRRLVVRRLELDQPSLHLVLWPDGRTNLDSLFVAQPAGAPATGGGAPMDLAVREFAVRGADLLVDDVRAARRTHATLDTKLELDAGSGGRIATRGRTRLGDLALGPMSARGPADLNQALAKLVFTLDHDGTYEGGTKTLTLRRLDLGFGRATVGLSGSVTGPGPGARLDLRARGDGLDLAELLRFAAAADARALHGISGGGRMAFDLHVTGPLGAAPGAGAAPVLPSLEGTLSIADGSFRYPGAPAGVDGLAFTARFRPDQVAIDDLRARVAGQALRAQLAVTRFAAPQARFALEGTLDLATLSQLLAPPDTKLAGRVELSVRGSGRLKDPGSIALDGRATVSNTSVESPQLPKKVEGIAATIELSPDKAVVRGLTARAGQSSFTLDASVTRPLALMAKIGKVDPAGLTFSLRSPYLDLAELLPPGPGSPLALNARGGGRVEIARLKNQKLDVENVVANVSLEPAVIAVPSFALRAYGGAISGNARFGFADPAMPTYAVHGRADTVKVERFLSAWTPVRDVLQGAASTTFDLSGAGTQPPQVRNSLTAVGAALLASGRLQGPVMEAIAAATRTPSLGQVDLRDLRLPFRVERGRVVTDSVRFRVGGEPWIASGMLGFDGALDYGVSATIPRSLVRGKTESALAAGLLGDASGNLLLDLRVTGPARAPRVALNSQAMRDRLGGKASTLLKEQRTRLMQTLAGAAAPRDSAGRDTAKVGTKELGRQLEKQGRDLLNGLLGKRKPAATAPAAPAAPADTAAK